MTILLKFAPAQGTIVFSGDKRLSTRSGGVADDAVKIAPLGRYSVGGVFGSTRHIDPQTGNAQRDVQAVMARFLENLDVSTATLGGFIDELKREHDSFVERYVREEMTPMEGVFQVLISSLEGDRIVDRLLRADIISGNSLDCVVNRLHDGRGRISASGDESVLRELKPISSNLSQLSGDPEIARLLDVAGCDYLNISIDRATQICRTIHNACSTLIPKNGPPTVSPSCDVIVVDAGGARIV